MKVVYTVTLKEMGPVTQALLRSILLTLQRIPEAKVEVVGLETAEPEGDTIG